MGSPGQHGARAGAARGTPRQRSSAVVGTDGGYRSAARVLSLRVGAEVVRYQWRGSRWALSLRCPDLPEEEQDRLRRRVFRAMREDRARAL